VGVDGLVDMRQLPSRVAGRSRPKGAAARSDVTQEPMKDEIGIAMLPESGTSVPAGLDRHGHGSASITGIAAPCALHELRQLFALGQSRRRIT
jgi:hypothetical protein